MSSYVRHSLVGLGNCIPESGCKLGAMEVQGIKPSLGSCPFVVVVVAGVVPQINGTTFIVE